jgi:hypothetical protein
VKAKAVYDKSKTNKEITKCTPSSRKLIPENMEPFLISIYNDTMEEIVNEYPFNIALPPDNRDYLKRYGELEKRGLTRTRKDVQ